MKAIGKLPLLILEAGLLVLLSGCDQMLDGIFPERQIIQVQVKVPLYHSVGLPGSSVNVQLTDGGASILTGPVAVTYSSYDSAFAYYQIQFTKLRNETYGLLAYYYDAATSGTYYSPYGSSFFYNPAGIGVTSVTLPYFQSSDITPVTVLVD